MMLWCSNGYFFGLLIDRGEASVYNNAKAYKTYINSMNKKGKGRPLYLTDVTVILSRMEHV